MLVTLFTTAASLSLFSRINDGPLSDLVVAYIALTLTVLAKGPVPAVLVAMTLSIYLVVRGPIAGERWYQMCWRNALRLHPIAGIAFVLVAAAPWYLLENATTHGAFFQEFFIRQNLGRAAGTVNHQEPWNFYFPYMIGGFFPWWMPIAYAPGFVVKIWSRRGTASKMRQLALFSLIWSITILVLFSAIKTKLPTYILPACPPLAVLCAVAMAVICKSKRQTALLLTSISAIAGVGMGLTSPFTNAANHAASACPKLLFLSGISALFCGYLASSVMVLRKNSVSACKIFVLTNFVSMALLVPTAIHIYDVQHDKPYRALLLHCTAPTMALAQMMRDSPAANFYLKRSVPTLVTKEELTEFVQKQPGKHFLIVTDDVLLFAVQRAPRLTLLHRESKFSLFCIDK
jgi:4-amino-4-deoxy-L-arabinose transferase-like glycosyltransferase